MRTIEEITVFAGDKFFCNIKMNKENETDINIKKLKNVIKNFLAIILKQPIDIDITYSERKSSKSKSRCKKRGKNKKINEGINEKKKVN